MEKFDFRININPFDNSIKTVRCTLGRHQNEKTFYGLMPFQMFFIRCWIKRSHKQLIKLEKLEKELCK